MSLSHKFRSSASVRHLVTSDIQFALELLPVFAVVYAIDERNSGFCAAPVGTLLLKKRPRTWRNVPCRASKQVPHGCVQVDVRYEAVLG